MLVYVMFALYTNQLGAGASWQYEFPTKIQCENSVKEIKKRFDGSFKVAAYCQEVRK